MTQNIITQQQEMTAKINQMLAQSADALMCGPDCQKNRQSEKLHQVYLDAQTNVVSAPAQLKQAEKNYYTFADGDAGYNSVLDKQLNQKADDMGSTMQQEFINNVGNVTSLNDTYDSLATNYDHVLELYNDYISENESLNNKIQARGIDIVTTDRKTYYETQNYDILLSWYNIFRWIYFMLVIIYIIAMFLVPSSFSLFYQVMKLIPIIIYPLALSYTIPKLYSIIEWLWMLYPKNIYKTL
jgi:hypothetical protein